RKKRMDLAGGNHRRGFDCSNVILLLIRWTWHRQPEEIGCTGRTEPAPRNWMIIAQNFPNKEFMSNHLQYNNCHVCNSTRIQFVLNAKDHTVTGEEFAVWECEDCSLRFTQNVPDSSSIGPYYKAEEYISHTSTSKGMINRLYQIVRRRTLVSKRKMLEKHTGKNSGSLLDYGSGTGNFANEMKRSGWKVTALEPDDDARKLAIQVHELEVQPLS